MIWKGILAILVISSFIGFTSLFPQKSQSEGMSNASLSQMVRDLHVEKAESDSVLDNAGIEVDTPKIVPPGSNFPVVIVIKPAKSYSSDHAWFTTRYRFLPRSEVTNILTKGVSDLTENTLREDNTGSIGYEYTWQNTKYLVPEQEVYLILQATAPNKLGRYPLLDVTYEATYGGNFSPLSRFYYTVSKK